MRKWRDIESPWVPCKHHEGSSDHWVLCSFSEKVRVCRTLTVSAANGMKSFSWALQAMKTWELKDQLGDYIRIRLPKLTQSLQLLCFSSCDLCFLQPAQTTNFTWVEGGMQEMEGQCCLWWRHSVAVSNVNHFTILVQGTILFHSLYRFAVQYSGSSLTRACKCKASSSPSPFVIQWNGFTYKKKACINDS